MIEHNTSVASMSSCFWALLSLPDYAFLHLPTAIMNTTVDHHSIKDLLLGKSLVDLIHPDERDLAKQDFYNFIHLNTLAGAVTRCRLRKLDCIANYDPSERPTNLDWIVVDVIMYTAAENILLTFFHCDQGFPACPHTQCDQENRTELNEIQDLSLLFQRYHSNDHVSHLQEQSIGTLRSFQLYNSVTRTIDTTWPNKHQLPSSQEDLVEAIQHDFHQALLHHRHHQPSFLPCTRHTRTTSNLILERHGTLKFEKILISYGQLTFGLFRILPTNRPDQHMMRALPRNSCDLLLTTNDHPASYWKVRSTAVSKSWRIKPNEKKRCESCQTSHSPEWRRGPSGHRTLCNACGLRYSRSLARQEHRVNLSPIISHAFVQSEELLSSSSSSSSSSTSSSNSSPSLPQYHLQHSQTKYPGQRRFFNLYP